jgi:glyoxylase-like metal-dependent hydrolase (beta-lactamase superfamily II)
MAEETPAMRIHHLDCGPMRPPGGALMDGVSRGAFGHLTCHCLAIETERDGLVLVDTGLGLRDMIRPWPRLPWPNAAMLRFRFDPDRTMLRRLKRLGHSPREVRHIVMTHLDFDHAGGLVDFPHASVHLMEAEARAATRPDRGLLDRIRYRRVQWGDTRRWRMYPDRAGGRWFGFDAVAQLDGLPPEILLVPLPGHTAGHAGVAVEAPGGWRLHAGDAYFIRTEVHGDGACPPGAAAYEHLMAWRPSVARTNRARLRALVRDPMAPVAVFCTHDPVEYVAAAILDGRRALPGHADERAAAAAAAA